MPQGLPASEVSAFGFKSTMRCDLQIHKIISYVRVGMSVWCDECHAVLCCAQVGSDDDGYSVRMKLKHFLRYLSDEKHAPSDDSPLYIFDGTFADRAGSKAMAGDYQVPPLWQEDLFQHVGERRRPPYRYCSRGLPVWLWMPGHSCGCLVIPVLSRLYCDHLIDIAARYTYHLLRISGCFRDVRASGTGEIPRRVHIHLYNGVRRRRRKLLGSHLYLLTYLDESVRELYPICSIVFSSLTA